MVKLFGWESEMHERIAVRRADEVKWLWKRKFYDTIVGMVKSVLPFPCMAIVIDGCV